MSKKSALTNYVTIGKLRKDKSKLDKKPSCCYGRHAAAYTVPVAVLTFKVIQGP